jgi:hypothetical protein
MSDTHQSGIEFRNFLDTLIHSYQLHSLIDNHQIRTQLDTMTDIQQNLHRMIDTHQMLGMNPHKLLHKTLDILDLHMHLRSKPDNQLGM